MRLLHRYIARDFLTTFLTAVSVLCFVLSTSSIFQISGLVARGATMGTILDFVGLYAPEMLAISIPVALLVSTLLVFGRLSSDNEIIAMRACGIPLRALMAAPLAVAVVLCGVCLLLNGTVGPRNNAARRELRHSVRVADFLSCVTPGQWVNTIPDFHFMAAEVERVAEDDAILRDVRIRQTEDGARKREIKAATARITKEGSQIRFDMDDVTMIDRHMAGIGESAHSVYRFDMEKPKGGAGKRRRESHLHGWTSLEILAALRGEGPRAAEAPEDAAARRVERARMKAELSRRAVFALSCVCFVAIAIPLGIRNQRRESAAGTAVCILVAASFYLFIIAAESLTRGVWTGGYAVAWIPVALCAALSVALVARNP